MNPTTIVELIIIGIYTFFTVGVYFYQARRYSALEKSLSSLNDILDSVTKYKDLFKPDDIINRLTTKHEIEKQTFEAQTKKDMQDKINDFKERFGKEVSEQITNIIMDMNKKLLDRLNELAAHSINVFITSEELSVNKEQRDALIKKLFPLNAESFIESCDTLLSRQKDATRS